MPTGAFPLFIEADKRHVATGENRKGKYGNGMNGRRRRRFMSKLNWMLNFPLSIFHIIMGNVVFVRGFTKKKKKGRKKLLSYFPVGLVDTKNPEKTRYFDDA